MLWTKKAIMGCVVLVVAAVPAHAGLVYDNGPVNSTPFGERINTDLGSGFAVTNSFTISSPTTLTSATVGLLVAQPNQPLSLEWSIGTTLFAADVASGTATLSNTLISPTNAAGYAVYESSFSLTGAVDVGTYWLTLENALSAEVPDTVLWNLSALSPNEAFIRDTFNNSQSATPVQGGVFQLFDGGMSATPEPASMTLLGVALVGLAVGSALRRRPLKRFTARSLEPA